VRGSVKRKKRRYVPYLLLTELPSLPAGRQGPSRLPSDTAIIRTRRKRRILKTNSQPRDARDTESVFLIPLWLLECCASPLSVGSPAGSSSTFSSRTVPLPAARCCAPWDLLQNHQPSPPLTELPSLPAGRQGPSLCRL